MKYYADPSFDVVTKNRYVKLIKHLFSHYEQFVAEVVGNDFEQSVYRNLLYPTASHDYYYYRRHRAYHYKEARSTGRSYVVKDLIPFEAFERDFQPPIVNAELSCLRLFIYAIEEIINNYCIVHDQNGKCFKLTGNRPYVFSSIISEIIAAQFPNRIVEKDENSLSCRFYTIGLSKEHLELIPVYTFMFKLLKKKKLDLKYQEISLKVFSQVRESITQNLVKMQIKELLTNSVQSTLNDEERERAIYNREQLDRRADLKRMLEMMKAPVIVEAYINVYEALPANYPIVTE